jgi:carboxyl-terminal processing protease
MQEIGVINIRSFYNNLHQDVIRSWKSSQAEGGWYPIDLRITGGGALSEATDLTGLFSKVSRVQW